MCDAIRPGRLFGRPFHVYPKEETDAVFLEATLKEPIEGAGLYVEAIVRRLLILLCRDVFPVSGPSTIEAGTTSPST
jgi:hypothetical protein